MRRIIDNEERENERTGYESKHTHMKLAFGVLSGVTALLAFGGAFSGAQAGTLADFSEELASRPLELGWESAASDSLISFADQTDLSPEIFDGLGFRDQLIKFAEYMKSGEHIGLLYANIDGSSNNYYRSLDEGPILERKGNCVGLSIFSDIMGNSLDLGNVSIMSVNSPDYGLDEKADTRDQTQSDIVKRDWDHVTNIAHDPATGLSYILDIAVQGNGFFLSKGFVFEDVYKLGNDGVYRRTDFSDILFPSSRSKTNLELRYSELKTSPFPHNVFDMHSSFLELELAAETANREGRLHLDNDNYTEARAAFERAQRIAGELVYELKHNDALRQYYGEEQADTSLKTWQDNEGTYKENIAVTERNSTGTNMNMLFSAGSEQLRLVQDNLNRGIRALNNSDYSTAAEALEAATNASFDININVASLRAISAQQARESGLEFSLNGKPAGGKELVEAIESKQSRARALMQKYKTQLDSAERAETTPTPQPLRETTVDDSSFGKIMAHSLNLSNSYAVQMIEAINTYNKNKDSGLTLRTLTSLKASISSEVDSLRSTTVIEQIPAGYYKVGGESIDGVGMLELFAVTSRNIDRLLAYTELNAQLEPLASIYSDELDSAIESLGEIQAQAEQIIAEMEQSEETKLLRFISHLANQAKGLKEHYINAKERTPGAQNSSVGEAGEGEISTLPSSYVIETLSTIENYSQDSNFNNFEMINELLEHADSQNPSIRLAAVKGLGIIGADSHSSLLTVVNTMLSDLNEDVRHTASIALRNMFSNSLVPISDTNIINACIEMTRSGESRLQIVNAEILGLLEPGNKDAISALANATKSEDTYVQMSAAKSLLKTGAGNETALNALASLLAQSTDINFYLLIDDMLEKFDSQGIDNTEFVSVLSEAYRLASPYDRGSPIEEFVKRKIKGESEEKHLVDAEKRRAIVKSLAKHGYRNPEALKILTQAISDPDDGYGEPVSQLAINGLKDFDFGKMNRDSVIEALVEHLDSKTNAEITYKQIEETETAISIIGFHNDFAKNVLLDRIYSHNNSWSPLWLLGIISQEGDIDVIRASIDALAGDFNATTAQFVLTSIAINNEYAINRLIELSLETEHIHHDAFLEILGEIGQTNASTWDHIKQLATSGDQKAQEVLKTLEDSQTLEISSGLDPDEILYGQGYLEKEAEAKKRAEELGLKPLQTKLIKIVHLRSEDGNTEQVEVPIEQERKIPKSSENVNEDGYAIHELPAHADGSILVMDFTSAENMNMLNRIALFTERAGTRGEVLNKSRLIDKQNFMYAGHNYSGQMLVDFFNEATEGNINLSGEERRLVRRLAMSGKISEKDGKYTLLQNFALISFARNASDYMWGVRDHGYVDSHIARTAFLHELSHAEYFTNPEYRNMVRKSFENLSPGEQEIVKAFLEIHGYDITDEDVLLTEYAAYLTDGKTFAENLANMYNSTIGSTDTSRRTKLKRAVLNELFVRDADAFIYNGIFDASLTNDAVTFIERTSTGLRQDLFDATRPKADSFEIEPGDSNVIQMPHEVEPVTIDGEHIVNVRIGGAGHSTILRQDVGCNREPCYFLDCKDNICMKAVSVENVVREVKRFTNL